LGDLRRSGFAAPGTGLWRGAIPGAALGQPAEGHPAGSHDHAESRRSAALPAGSPHRPQAAAVALAAGHGTGRDFHASARAERGGAGAVSATTTTEEVLEGLDLAGTRALVTGAAS